MKKTILTAVIATIVGTVLGLGYYSRQQAKQHRCVLGLRRLTVAISNYQNVESKCPPNLEALIPNWEKELPESPHPYSYVTAGFKYTLSCSGVHSKAPHGFLLGPDGIGLQGGSETQGFSRMPGSESGNTKP